MLIYLYAVNYCILYMHKHIYTCHGGPVPQDPEGASRCNIYTGHSFQYIAKSIYVDIFVCCRLL